MTTRQHGRGAPRGRRRGRLPAVLSVAVLLATATLAPARGSADELPEPGRAREESGTTVSFRRELANLEYLTELLVRRPPDDLARVPTTAEPLWFGQIPYREPGVAAGVPTHPIVFAAVYRGGVAERVWADRNRDGDLTDDSTLTLLRYPGSRGARSLLVDVTWRDPTASAPGASEKIRVVLDSVAVDSLAPAYRVQRVFAPIGEVTIAGKPHRAVLYDGNWDGRYGLDFADGIFVDWDDDRSLTTDPMSPEFGPFRVPFTMAGRRLTVTSVDSAGNTLALLDLGPAPVERDLEVGAPAPDFDFLDEHGASRSLRGGRGEPAIVYFWASWCATCSFQTPPLIQVYERFHGRGLTLIAVSYDTEPAEVRRYQERYRPPWPILYTGRAFWENPVGRLYQAHGAGIMFLVDREGRLEGRYTSVPELAARLGTLFR